MGLGSTILAIRKIAFSRLMSALGHERRFGRVTVASALRPIATKSVQALNAVLGQKLPHASAAKVAGGTS
jgi:hypothetical protein